MEYRESYTTELKKVINADFKKEVIAFAKAIKGNNIRNKGIICSINYLASRLRYPSR